MAIEHAQAGEVIDVRPLGTTIENQQTITLVKTDALQVIRLVLPAGKSIAPHQVPGEVTVQCLEGEVVFETHGSERRLTAGNLLYLAGSDEHGLRAVQDASLLVTILLAKGDA